MMFSLQVLENLKVNAVHQPVGGSCVVCPCSVSSTSSSDASLSEIVMTSPPVCGDGRRALSSSYLCAVLYSSSSSELFMPSSDTSLSEIVMTSPSDCGRWDSRRALSFSYLCAALYSSSSSELFMPLSDTSLSEIVVTSPSVCGRGDSRRALSSSYLCAALYSSSSSELFMSLSLRASPSSSLAPPSSLMLLPSFCELVCKLKLWCTLHVFYAHSVVL